jgi:hypothetical protein
MPRNNGPGPAAARRDTRRVPGTGKTSRVRLPISSCWAASLDIASALRSDGLPSRAA